MEIKTLEDRSMEMLVLDFCVCPHCQSIVTAENISIVANRQTGLVLGYYSACPECNHKEFINLLGKPPLFDLSSKFYATS
jgi:hypothetical protein